MRTPADGSTATGPTITASLTFLHVPLVIAAAVLVVAFLATAAVRGAADLTERYWANELDWEPRPAGQWWCGVLPDVRLARLAGWSWGPGPWQQLVVREDTWSCTVVADLDGRRPGGSGLASPSLLDISTRLTAPPTPPVIASGNDSPPDQGVEGELRSVGSGVLASSDLGLAVLRRPCRQASTPDGVVPDDLEVRSFVTPTHVLSTAEVVELMVISWQQASVAYGCRGPR